MHKFKWERAALAAVMMGALAMAGCEKQDGVKDEVYAGTFGQKPCTESYKLPVNVTRCEQQQGRGGN